MRVLVLLAGVAVACGDDATGSQSSGGETGTGDQTGGSPVTSTDPTTTTGADSDTDTGSSTGGGANSYAGYFRVQSFGSYIQLLGNFLESYNPAGGTTVGLCTKLGTSTGLAVAGGTITVLRGDEVLLVAELPGAPTASATLATGDQLTFEGTAPAGLLPDFSAGPLIVPSFPTDVVGPDSIATGESVTISWTPPANASGDVLVELVQSPAGVNKIQCVVPVSDGSVTIDASLLTHLVPTDADNPNVQMAVSPFDEVLAVVDGKAVEFEFLAGLATFVAPVVAG